MAWGFQIIYHFSCQANWGLFYRDRKKFFLQLVLSAIFAPYLFAFVIMASTFFHDFFKKRVNFQFILEVNTPTVKEYFNFSRLLLRLKTYTSYNANCTVFDLNYLCKSVLLSKSGYKNIQKSVQS